MGAYIAGKSLSKSVSYAVKRTFSRTRPNYINTVAPAGETLGYGHTVYDDESTTLVYKITIANMKLFTDQRFNSEVTETINNASLVQIEDMLIRYVTLDSSAGNGDSIKTGVESTIAESNGGVSYAITMDAEYIYITFSFDHNNFYSMKGVHANVTQIRFVGFWGKLKYNGKYVAMSNTSSINHPDDGKTPSSWTSDFDLSTRAVESVIDISEIQLLQTFNSGDIMPEPARASTQYGPYVPYLFIPHGYTRYYSIEEKKGASYIEYA